MTLNEEKNEFSALAASRRSTRAFTDREMPAGVIDAILADATTAPSWSNTRAFRVAIASGARAQRLRERFGKLFDEEIEAHARKVIDPDVEIPVPDGDYPVRKRYPDELLPAQIEVAKLLYGTYGVERADIEGRNRVNRRNVTAFDAPVMGFVFVHEDMLPWSAMDAGLMLQTLFLSAKSRGIRAGLRREHEPRHRDSRWAFPWTNRWCRRRHGANDRNHRAHRAPNKG